MKMAESDVEQGEIDAVFRTLREEADASSFGRFISDNECRNLAAKVIIALKDYQSGRSI
jgi:hypothetical protein